MKAEYIVSACLAGRNCRYDCGSRPCQAVIDLVRAGRAIPVCPESLSGLPTPREPCEQKAGRIISRDGSDRTAEFELGARRALKQALDSGCRKAILKARSPSCGLGEIYNGNFDRTLVQGNGVFTQKLLANGFQIWTEACLPDPA